jgi:hypothetical protein
MGQARELLARELGTVRTSVAKVHRHIRQLEKCHGKECSRLLELRRKQEEIEQVLRQIPK